jgi:hypothetical protein
MQLDAAVPSAYGAMLPPPSLDRKPSGRTRPRARDPAAGTDEDCDCDPGVNRGARFDPGGAGGGTVHRRHRRAGGGVTARDGGAGRQ